jgi:hypothetical protein
MALIVSIGLTQAYELLPAVSTGEITSAVAPGPFPLEK